MTRVSFFGDSFTAGQGDDDCLGYVGRLGTMARRQGCDITLYNCGIRGDTSGDIRRRWRGEAEARLAAHPDGRLVFSFGANDCVLDPVSGRLRVALDDSVANARAILTEALAFRPTLFFGVLAAGDDEATMALTRAYAVLCEEIGAPFLDVTAISAPDTVWRREALAGDGAHPNAGGYAALAEAVAAWAEWKRLTSP